MLFTYLSRVSTVVLSLVPAVLAARLLGPEGRGYIATGTILVALCSEIGGLGLPNANTYFVARQRNLLSALLGNSLLLGFGVGGLVSIFTLVVCRVYPQLAPLPGLVFVVALVWIPLQMVYNLCQSLLLGLGQIHTNNKLDVMSRILSALVIPILFCLNAVRVGSVFAGLFISTLPFLAYIVWTLFQQSGARLLLSKSLLRRSWRYCFMCYFGRASTFLIVNVDLLLVSRMLGEKQAGYYSVAVSLGSCILLLAQAITTHLLSQLPGLATFNERWRVALDVTKKTTGLTLVLCLAAGFFANSAIFLLFGPKFGDAVPVFWILLPGIFALSTNATLSAASASSEHPLASALIAPTLALQNIVFNFYFIEKYGIQGVAANSTLTYFLLLMSTIAYTQYYRKYLADTMDVLGKTILPEKKS